MIIGTVVPQAQDIQDVIHSRSPFANRVEPAATHELGCRFCTFSTPKDQGADAWQVLKSHVFAAHSRRWYRIAEYLNAFEAEEVPYDQPILVEA